MYESGFAATPVSGGVTKLDDQQILVQGLTVVREPVTGNDIPSLVIRMRYTDRGTASQGVIDAQVRTILEKAGFRVSRATSFKPQDVTWKWQLIGKEAAGDVPIYVPVVATPAEYAGLKYAGSAFPEPLYQPTAAALAKLPNQIWVYTIGVTSAQNTMTDGEAAQGLTLLKQAMVNLANTTHSAVNVRVTARGCPESLFQPKPGPSPIAIGTFSGLILLAAYNMLSPNIRAY
jgi:hypothetical protein